jgi:tetratricopeptide (TPR) repeat protein
MYDQVLAKDPANVIALCETGMLLVNKGQTKKGQDLLERALKSGNTYTPCYYYTGYIYGKTGNREKALQMFDEASRMSPADYAIQAYKARMFEETGKLPEAAAAYRGALEIILGLD